MIGEKIKAWVEKKILSGIGAVRQTLWGEMSGWRR